MDQNLRKQLFAWSKGLPRLIVFILWLVLALSFKEGAVAWGFRFWVVTAFFGLATMSLADLIVFILTEINSAYFTREMIRVEIESGFTGHRDRVDGDRWKAWMAARKGVLQSANRRVTFLCYAFGWLNPLIVSHCHRLMIYWRWELKDWRGVKQSISWTRSHFSKSNDPRIFACHIVWDYWKDGILPSEEAYSTETLMCVLWNSDSASLPFFLAASILLHNNKKDEALKILLKANEMLKSPSVNEFIAAIRKNRWKTFIFPLSWDLVFLDFINCLKLAFQERNIR